MRYYPGFLNYTGNSATYTRGFELRGLGGGVEVEKSGTTVTIDGGNITSEGSVFRVGGAGNAVIKSDVALGTGGLSLEGTGTKTFAGHCSYSGVTSIGSPTVLTGTIVGTAGVYIHATLMGDGEIMPAIGGFVVLTLGGKIAPGVGVGTLSLTFDDTGYFNTSGATDPGVGGGEPSLFFDLRAPQLSDRMVITGGSMEIGSGVLGFEDFVFSRGQGFDVGDYVLFDASTPIVGSLGPGVVGPLGSGLFTGELQISADGTDLILHVVPEPGSGLLLAGGMVFVANLRGRGRT